MQMVVFLIHKHLQLLIMKIKLHPQEMIRVYAAVFLQSLQETHHLKGQEPGFMLADLMARQHLRI
jgi:hypothetical protein